jgi:hypothetical protein
MFLDGQQFPRTDFFVLKRPSRTAYAMTNEKSALLSKHLHKNSNYVLVIHGGAGTMTRNGSTPEERAAYHKALKQALRAGYAVLSDGGEAIDAVVAAVTVMEGMCFKRLHWNVAVLVKSML